MVAQLSEVLRKFTSPLTQNISELEQEVQYRTERKRAHEEQLRTAEKEYQENRASQDQFDSQERTLRNKVAEIETEMRRLEESRQALQVQQRTLQEEIHGLRDGLKSSRDRQQEAQRAIRALDDEVQQKTSNLQRIRQELFQARKGAFHQYLTETWRGLEAARRSHADIARRQAIKDEFEGARHRDPEIMQLWEQRQELIKLQDAATIPSIKDMISREIVKIDSTLNSKFPQIREAMSAPTSANNEIIELYCARDQERGTQRLFVPIPADVWELLENGVNNEATQLAVDVVWSLAKWLPHLPDIKPKFYREDELGLNLVEIAGLDFDLQGSEPPTIRVGDHVSVDVLVSDVPIELREILAC